MANRDISVGVKITGNAKDFKSAANDAQKASERLKNSISKNTSSIKSSFSSVDDQLKSLVGSIGAVYLAQRALNEIWDSFVTSVKESGVRAAFIRLNDPTLLDNLRKATHGTVSDLKLMTAAVQSKNLGIALNQLPLYFEFATRRAKDTGQAVDELVKNIVDGVGRESPRVIDNLGISQVALRKELEKTGNFAEAVGNIMSKSMSEAGGYVEDTTDSLARMSAQMENIKSKAGTLFGEAGFTGTVEVLSEALNVLNTLLVENNDNIDDNTIKVWQWKRAVASYLEVLNKVIIAKRQEKNEDNISKPFQIPAAQPIIKSIETLDILREKRKSINDQINQTNILDTKTLSLLYKQRDAIDAKIEAVERLGKKTLEEIYTGVDLELFRRKFKDLDTIDKELLRIRKNITLLYEAYDAGRLTESGYDNLASLTKAFDLITQIRKELVSKEPKKDALGLPSLSVIDDYKNKLADMGNSTKSLKLDIEKLSNAGLILSSEFEYIFQSMTDGWDNFSDAVNAAIERLLIKIGALIAAYMVLNALTGGSFGSSMSLGNFILKGFGLGDLTNIGSSTSSLGISAGNNITLTSNLKGRDILLSSNRYNNTLIKNT